MRNATPGELPMTWREALAFVAGMNCERALGFSNCRLPGRRELRSLVSHQTRRPALAGGHPFVNVFAGWYWSATSAAGAPAHAWYVDMDGGRMFYGGKDQSFLAWPGRCGGKVTCCRLPARRCATTTRAGSFRVRVRDRTASSALVCLGPRRAFLPGTRR